MDFIIETHSGPYEMQDNVEETVCDLSKTFKMIDSRCSNLLQLSVYMIFSVTGCKYVVKIWKNCVPCCVGF